MINALAARRLLFLTTMILLLACDQDSGEGKATSSAPAEMLSSERAQAAYDFVNSIGANTHLNYFDRTYGNFQLVQRELASIGIFHLRDGVHLQNDDYNKALYGRWAQLGKSGIHFDAVIDPRSNLGPLTPEKLDQVQELANHSIESFEGPNEMDISNISDWASIDRDYQRSVYQSAEAMKDAKSIAVIGPSLASASRGSSLGKITDCVSYGNLHPYPAGKMPSAVFPEQLQLAQEVSSNKKVFVTESGYHNALNDHSDQPAVSEAAAGKYIPRLFLENFSRGIPRTYLYELLDEAPDPGLANFQMHWGLIRSNGSEKPAFTALKNLISEVNDSAEPVYLRQLTYSLSVQSANLHHLLLQRSDGQFFLILWQEVPSYDTRSQKDIAVLPLPVTLTLDRSFKNVSTYEPVIQAKPLEVFANIKTISLQVPDHPLVVQIAPQ